MANITPLIMRIAIETQSTIGQATGIGQAASKLLQALRQVAPQHEYIEIKWGKEVKMRLDRRLYWQQWRVPYQTRQVQADILHVPGFDAPFWSPCPTILTVHDLIGMVFPQNLPPVARFYWSKWLPFSTRFAHHILADSEHTRQDIIQRLKIPDERITVVPLSYDTSYRPITDQTYLQSIRQKYQLPQRFILFVSTLEPRKGIDTLIQAFAQIQPTEVGLVIVGKRGWYTEQIFALVDQLQLKNKIIFTDYVADQDLAAFYNLAELLAFPSRYEGFGLTVLEAMACGTPVVCSNSSSLPEIVGEAALKVSPDQPEALAQAMTQVLAHETLRQEMRAKGLQQAQQFSWEKTAQNTLAIYEAVYARMR